MNKTPEHLYQLSFRVKERLIELQSNGDTEIAHIKADDVLCDFLGYLGYSDIVEEYKKVKKWYA